jgi:P27 family predicted phage terminase small subunit
MPSHLPAEGRAEWNRICRYLTDRGLLHSADINILEAHVSAVCRHRRVEAALARVELLQAEDEGQLLPEQMLTLSKTAKELLIQANQAAAAIARSSSALCLNPSSRLKMPAEVRKDPGSLDESAEWNRTLRRVK